MRIGARPTQVNDHHAYRLTNEQLKAGRSEQFGWNAAAKPLLAANGPEYIGLVGALIERMGQLG